VAGIQLSGGSAFSGFERLTREGEGRYRHIDVVAAGRTPPFVPASAIISSAQLGLAGLTAQAFSQPATGLWLPTAVVRFFGGHYTSQPRSHQPRSLAPQYVAVFYCEFRACLIIGQLAHSNS